MKVLILAAVLIVAGCSNNLPPPPEGLQRPPAWAMTACDRLPDIPKGDGDPAVRREYEKKWRPAYVECAAKVEVLVKHVDAVSPNK